MIPFFVSPVCLSVVVLRASVWSPPVTSPSSALLVLLFLLGYDRLQVIPCVHSHCASTQTVGWGLYVHMCVLRVREMGGGVGFPSIIGFM